MKLVDQMGREIHCAVPPKRIVSLVPSQTEYLYDLGLGNRVVGITKFCVHPNEWFRSKTRIGGTKTVAIDKVKALKPDLIIGNKEENTKSDIEQLENIAPTWMSDIFTLEDSFQMMLKIGRLVDLEDKSKEIVQAIKEAFDDLKASPKLRSIQGKRVLYLIWKDPYMGAANQTFIHHLLTDILGLENTLKMENRYPEITDISKINPDFIFLSSEPYPFKDKHLKEICKNSSNTKAFLVDGEYFSWYGSRLLNAPIYFQQLIAQL